MSVYGIDLSTSKIAIVKLLPNKGFEVVELISKSKSWETRFKELYRQMFPWVRDSITSDDLICIEDIPLVQNRQSLIKLVHILAMCRTVFTHYDIDVFTVNVMTWKKDVVGNGKADKDKVKVMAQKIYGESINQYSQDAIDALMVAKWGELRVS
jgi:Holliday junction resolvasome RuvABC endonuclease subunit